MLLRGRIPVTYIINKIKYEVLAIALYATLVWFFREDLKIQHITIPLGVPTILGTVLSLLLAFRSNQAYDRWWEARMIWGAIVNDSRTFQRQVLSFMQIPYTADGETNEFQKRMVNRQIAWCYSLGNSLRKQNSMEGLDRYVSKKEMNFIQSIDNAPSAIINLHGKDIRMALEEGWINEFQQVSMDETLTRLCDSMGKCERIKSTVFPTTYSLYLHWALYFFILLLPFGVIEYVGVIEIPLVTMLASFFLLIEKMAVHLQDPFENKPTDTPMTAIARNIERNLKQVMEGQDHHHLIPEAVPVPSKHYYIL
ncbi:MAG: bestrophin family ion channel [Candidatus Pseudobacter hemicellulosilyticus]|uniref:Bestrophin family ion channel n=1 Tax=Candidatus Pseudobacter hemicellulosilyticus TaxID=3121375 RepID=A0AAJ5WYN0_9BACT|nr:MAG: bestrophin family ion channel [Pseudobacter sp.]